MELALDCRNGFTGSVGFCAGSEHWPQMVLATRSGVVRGVYVSDHAADVVVDDVETFGDGEVLMHEKTRLSAMLVFVKVFGGAGR